jgi:tetratricopeptide (TPR) repeat protein
MEYGRLLLENKNHHEAIKWFDVAIELAYDLDQKSEAIYYKAEALYEQGNKLKALICLEDSPGEDYGYHSKYSIPELRDKIKSELNPFSNFFKK